ncbi:MAG: hypothetical protein AAF850_10830 [Pseudomonadota bacterium]
MKAIGWIAAISLGLGIGVWSIAFVLRPIAGFSFEPALAGLGGAVLSAGIGYFILEGNKPPKPKKKKAAEVVDAPTQSAPPTEASSE